MSQEVRCKTNEYIVSKYKRKEDTDKKIIIHVDKRNKLKGILEQKIFFFETLYIKTPTRFKKFCPHVGQFMC